MHRDDGNVYFGHHNLIKYSSLKLLLKKLRHLRALGSVQVSM